MGTLVVGQTHVATAAAARNHLLRGHGSYVSVKDGSGQARYDGPAWPILLAR